MENISYIGLSQQMALQQQMNVTANNLANMNTPGFKGQGMMFLEYLNKAKGSTETVKQVQDFATYRNLDPGPLQQTNNDLDLAINGDGYFAVQTPGGTRYTRDGSFSLNNANEIVTKSGYPVLGDNGAPIKVQQGASRITVSADGEISTNLGSLGKVKVVTFDNPQKMTEEGDNLLAAAAAGEKPAPDARVAQGMLEGSNVNPIVEMNRMIEVLRQYQSAQKMLMNDHERIRGAIQRLAKV